MDAARIEELKSLLPKAMLPDWVRLGRRLLRILQDRAHPSRHDALVQRLWDEVHSSIQLRQARQANVPVTSYPHNLPITARKDDIVAAIRNHQVLVLAGETGSGKTTQLPKMCLEAGLGIEAKIGCTQPRRVAALSISQRIAQELRVPWGREVGCKIRFDDRSSPQTFIKLMTDGILLAETQADPTLCEYNAIIIDEAHERSLNIDFLIGYLKSLLKRRKDLKLIITSATIDTKSFSEAFDGAPVIEVSGRVYPVEVVYSPLTQSGEDSMDIDYVEGAVQAVETLLCEPGQGDILVFMPSEKDIRDTTDLLTGRFTYDAEIIPLFGRLSSADQQRVFAESRLRKVIVATNIAETSLTIPGIRYVVDAGLARISRYNPRTRTKRLPIEAISQSSANQRKGRAGRVQSGVCIRLYSEEDFESRPAFTIPEIQRANLAEVILRMKAYHLGEIESFGFINPPAPNAISTGFALLQELGALDAQRNLTQLGSDLARLPIDPTLGRMLVQSRKEGAIRELLVIASGLSVQDPRERPADQKESADSAHRKFIDPQSDFLTLLNLWRFVEENWEKHRTQGQRRKFCKSHFLSYLRIREWHDLHAQLKSTLEDIGGFEIRERIASYDSIHRSILSGLLGHVAQRTERNTFKCSGNRLASMFAGSVLYERADRTPKPANTKQSGLQKPRSSKQPEWIVAGELVETSQLFTRTTAGIDPCWILQLAPDLCSFSHHHPHWSPNAGRVLATEKVMFHGLEIQQRKVAFSNIDPVEATRIFIRSALVEGQLFPEPGASRGRLAASLPTPRTLTQEQDRALNRGFKFSLNQVSANDDQQNQLISERFGFMEQNQKLKEKIETWQTRVRRHDLRSPDDALFDFYAGRIKNVASLHELNRWLGENGGSDRLKATESDISGGNDLAYDPHAFPEKVELSNHVIPLHYAYAPGEEHDGVTVRLGMDLAMAISPSKVDWSIPGLREDLAMELLRALPKSIRKELMPLQPKVAEIVAKLSPSGASLLQDIAAFLRLNYGVQVQEQSWPENALPRHLRPRVEVLGHDQKVIAAGRDLNHLRRSISVIPVTKPKPNIESDHIRKLRNQWEKFDLHEWNFGDLPDRISLPVSSSGMSYLWPGLLREDDSVSLKLFTTIEARDLSSPEGFRRLVELAISKDLAWAEKDLKTLSKHDAMIAPWCDPEAFREAALKCLKNSVLPKNPPIPLSQRNFIVATAASRETLRKSQNEMISRLAEILRLRDEIYKKIAPSKNSSLFKLNNPPLKKQQTIKDLQSLGDSLPIETEDPWMNELRKLVHPDFPKGYSLERLAHLPRFLKALAIRRERALVNPQKEQEKSKQLIPYQVALEKLTTTGTIRTGSTSALEDFRWLIEEFKVSLFAQELGTSVPISPKRLDEQWSKVQQLFGV